MPVYRILDERAKIYLKNEQTSKNFCPVLDSFQVRSVK